MSGDGSVPVVTVHYVATFTILCYQCCRHWCSVAVIGLLQYKAFLRLTEVNGRRRRQASSTEDLNQLIQTVSSLLNRFFSEYLCICLPAILSTAQQLSSRYSAHTKCHCLLHRGTRKQQVMMRRLYLTLDMTRTVLTFDKNKKH